MTMLKLESDANDFHTYGNRSSDTCHWKCGDDCAKPAPNASANEYFHDIIQSSVDRRSFLKGSLASVMVMGGLSASAVAAVNDGINFTPIKLNTDDKITLANGYSHNVVIRWGDPIARGARRFDVNNWDAASQEASFGYNVDYISWLPLPGYGSKTSMRALLWANHEYTNPELMFPNYQRGKPTKAQVDIELAAHGGTIVEVSRNRDGEIEYLPVSRFNRRITATTPMDVTGPAAGHPLLQTKDDPTGKRVLGTLNNCAGGTTPWGTVLTAEENFNQYFAFNDEVTDAKIKAAHARYGLPAKASGRVWEQFYPRFDLRVTPNEPFRHGYIVEIDPYDPSSTPKKRTALGRFKHEGAETSLAADGRVVMYMGDDERFDYMYKFVTKGKFSATDRASNMTLLDEGTLYVAKLNADGSGQWLPMIAGTGPLTAAAGFPTQAEVCVMTRQAADLMGATKMDRPEDFERNPVTGAVYCLLTNNSNRTAAQIDAANPRASNRDGHIVELLEDANDAAAIKFKWSLFMVCGNPSDPTTFFAGYPKEKVSPVATPDNCSFDAKGNLWIATDGMDNSNLKAHDGVFAVPTQGPDRGFVRQFMSAPKGAEVCGPIFTPDNKNFFAGIQHPGEGGTVEKPVSLWPDVNGQVPRPSVVAIRKDDKGIIGS